MNAQPEKSVYYVSTRPEAYEVWGEVGHEEARELARMIAEHAARQFPRIEFRVDDAWHVHPQGMELIAAFIDDHWREWAVERAANMRTA